MAKGTFEAWINPLAFLPLDLPKPAGGPPVTANDFLEFMCATDTPAEPEELARRYRELPPEPVQLFAVPAEQRILDKLIWPLRHAKGSLLLGNHIGAIALAGMVAEMVAILLFELTEAQLNGKPMNAKHQEALFGREFEKLDQFRRVKVLEAYGLIDVKTREAFENIRTTRRRYLHLWSQDHEALPEDAIKAFHSAVVLVVAAVGQGVSEGAVQLNPALVKYLEKAGKYRPESDDAA